ncbi:MAG TPA: bifunctional folylpolyglutamate synthase/dihydrofolate synthase, partial [Candidatus Binatia bacterium]|nr:bifunctional folylpolyglutamate synthase/dihydrofolate synthase [Candidatus Binatia bacterium]
GNLIFDVAHNVEAAQVLADNLAAARVGRIHVVLGMLSDKPVEGFCAAIAPHALHFHAASLPPPRGLDARALVSRATGAGVPLTPYADVAGALDAARAAAAGTPVLACGSFLTVAAAMERAGG